LRIAEDALLLDNSALTPAQSIAAAIRLVEERLAERGTAAARR
jgi:hypothetical protein